MSDVKRLRELEAENAKQKRMYADLRAHHRHRGHARTGPPMVLFPTRIVGGGVDAQHGREYDVAPDGRFLINTELNSAAAPIMLLMNWNPEAKKCPRAANKSSLVAQCL